MTTSELQLGRKMRDSHEMKEPRVENRREAEPNLLICVDGQARRTNEIRDENDGKYELEYIMKL